MSAGRVRSGYALEPEEGEAIWLQGGVCMIKASGDQTGQQFALSEQLMPRGMCTPLHIQPDEDELFYVLEGALTFSLGGELIPAGPRKLVCIPRGSVHGFRVESDTARFLVLNTPAGHERWFRAAGEPAGSLAFPTRPFDADRADNASRSFGYTVVGPFPAAEH